MLSKLGVFLSELHVKKVHIVTGKRAWEATRSYLSADIVRQAQTNFTLVEGYCTVQSAEEIADCLLLNEIDAVIGIGGGTVLDITKAAAITAAVKSVLIPTVAATCAVWTPLSVFYDDSGTFTHFTEFPVANTLVLVEPAIIAKAPVKYLKAGVGDTLAKYYEADALINAFYKKQAHPVWLQVSQFSAKICKEVLLEHAEAAINDASKGIISPALVNVIEAVIMTGGMVGGFGGKVGRIAGAHSVHNGLTEAEEVKDVLHGELVAYGILVQLALEEKVDEILKLMTYYKAWGLPTELGALGIQPTDDRLLSSVVKKITTPTESIHLMEQKITETTVFHAIARIEQLNS